MSVHCLSWRLVNERAHVCMERKIGKKFPKKIVVIESLFMIDEHLVESINDV